ncbi:MAG: hypothetical protein H0U79_07815 [Solirubrobacterales bacterium]|nr:hypothetical protein [Solirubrobacterales bacterium]
MHRDDFSSRLHAELETHGPAGHPSPGPHICPACTAPFVTPIEALEIDEWHFAVKSYCPNCGWEGAGIFDDEALERYDVGLDEGTHALAEALALLEHENARSDFARFRDALAAEAILPEDF